MNSLHSNTVWIYPAGSDFIFSINAQVSLILPNKIHPLFEVKYFIEAEFLDHLVVSFLAIFTLYSAQSVFGAVVVVTIAVAACIARSSLVLSSVIVMNLAGL